MQDHLIWGRMSAEKFDEVRPEIDRQIALAEMELSRIAPPPILDLHPAAVAAYGEAMGQLHEILSEGGDTGAEGLGEAVRGLVHSVIVHPSPAGAPMRVEIIGQLSALMGKDDVLKLGVAGARTGRYRQETWVFTARA
jgi:hypothetical protein